jgi:HEAT repeat protein
MKLLHPFFFSWWLSLFLTSPLMAGIELPYRNEATRQLLIELLKDEDRVQRIRAVQQLALAEDPRNLDELKKALNDPEEVVRQQAVRRYIPGLGTPPAEIFRPRPGVGPEFISTIHRDPRIRQKARLNLLESDPAYKEDFSKLLDDPDYFVRRALSAQVVKARGVSSSEIWRKLLSSGNLNDQIEAAWAVGQLNSKTDEAALLTFVDSESERLRLISLESLQVIGGDATRNELGAKILKHSKLTQEALMRLAAILQARPALSAIRQVVVDKDAGLLSRLLGLDVIREMADVEAKTILLQLVKDYSPMPQAAKLREYSALALGIVGDPSSLDPLKRLVTDRIINVPMVGSCYDSESTRIAGVKAIENLKGIDTLKSFLSLPFIGEPDATEKLRLTLAESLTRVTGTKYDYRRNVGHRSYFVESLKPEEYSPEASSHLQKPPVYQAN